LTQEYPNQENISKRSQQTTGGSKQTAWSRYKVQEAKTRAKQPQASNFKLGFN